MSVLAPKLETVQDGPPKIKIVVFSKTAPTIFIKCQEFMETPSLNKTARLEFSLK
jgi:hypothetical protein